MPQQLLYTSAPRGIVAGRSGHCTVARSAAMREALMLQLERFSYYQHLSLSGGQERPIYTCRIVDLRGSRFHVLSRIQDAGLDFTGRTNFIAHHLVFTPEEIPQHAPPPVILRNWPGWAKSWTREPGLLENEDWSGLAALAGIVNVPAQTWQRVTGDAVNGFGLLERRTAASLSVDDLSDEDTLLLFAESLELLQVRDKGNDYRVAAWNYTFTTSMQEQDNPADFRWRCIHSDNPAAIRFATPDGRALTAVRAAKFTSEEMTFARTGCQPPQFAVQPQDLKISEGETAQFTARAGGVPSPTYQWHSVDRFGNITVLPGQTNSQLVVVNPVLGVSRYRVSAANSSGTVQSNVAILNVDPKPRQPQSRTEAPKQSPVGTEAAARPNVIPYVKSAEEIEQDRQRRRAKKEQEDLERRQRRNLILLVMLAVIMVLIAGVFGVRQYVLSSQASTPAATNETAKAVVVTNVAVAPKPVVKSAVPVTNNVQAKAPSPLKMSVVATTNVKPEIFTGGPLLTFTNPSSHK